MTTSRKTLRCSTIPVSSVQCPLSPCQIFHGTQTSVSAHSPSWQWAMTCVISHCDICSMGVFLTSGGNSWHGGTPSCSTFRTRRAGHRTQHFGGHGMLDGSMCWHSGSRHHTLVARSASSTCSACTRVRGRSVPSRRLLEIGENTCESSTAIAYCIGSSGGSRDNTVDNVQRPVVSVS